MPEPARRTRLKGLRLSELSAVPRGANQHAHVLLCKSDDVAKGPGADALNQALDMGDATDRVDAFREAVREVLCALDQACCRIQDDDSIADKAAAVQDAVDAALAALPAEVDEEASEGDDDAADGGATADMADMAKAALAPADPFKAMSYHAGRLKRRLGKATTPGHITRSLNRFYVNTTGVLAAMQPAATPPSTPPPAVPPTDPAAVAKALATLAGFSPAVGEATGPPSTTESAGREAGGDEGAASPAALSLSDSAPPAAGDGSSEETSMPEGTTLEARVAELETQLADANQAKERVETEKRDLLAKAEAKAPEAEAIAKQLEVMKADLKAASDRAAQAEATALVEKRAREWAELLKEAGERYAYLGAAEEVAKDLQDIRALPDEGTRERLTKRLRDANAARAQLAVEKGYGAPVPATPYDTLTSEVLAKADELQGQDPKLTRAQAMDAAERLIPNFGKRAREEAN